jgi:hypothetical protein
MHRTLLAAACLAATFLAADASAQPPGGRGRWMGMGGGMSHAALLRQDAVQADLGIPADLKAKITSELPERGPGGGAGGGAGNLRDMTDEQRQKWMDERRARVAEEDKKVAGLLSPEQLARLKQIRVQALGAGVLMDETLAKELSITDDQISKLQSAMRDMRQGGGGGGNPGEMRAKMTAKAMEILSTDQKAKLEALKGPAFDVSKLQMRAPGGGGRPGAGS